MQVIYATHQVVDLSDCGVIAGAVAADPITGEVLVMRRSADGTEMQQLLYVGAGVRIVRRR